MRATRSTSTASCATESWWDYYLLALAYKVPEGTWALAVLAVWCWSCVPRRARASWFDELTLLASRSLVLVVMSVFTNINLGLRYVLPIFPYLFISAESSSRGQGRWPVVGVGSRGALWACVSRRRSSATLAIHPHYLAYFNGVSGGPVRGSEHLIDSNLDWGQDLVGLKRLGRRQRPGRAVGLAYFGQINPDIFRLRHAAGDPESSLNWFLPPPVAGDDAPVAPAHSTWRRLGRASTP